MPSIIATLAPNHDRRLQQDQQQRTSIELDAATRVSAEQIRDADQVPLA